MTTIDSRSPDLVTAEQCAGWSAQAPHWYAQLDAIERQWGVLSDGLLDLARVTAGDRVLDLACGVGDPALAAAARVGPSGCVIATDLSPDMLAYARRRAEAAGLRTLEVHEMDAAAIDLPDGEVDVVLSRLGLMFVSDLDAALAGVHRVLVPGGRFAAAIPWRPAENAMHRLMSTLLTTLELPPMPPPGPGRPGIFSLADASVVCAALERAGLTEVRITPYTLVQDHRSPDEWLDFVLALNVPLRQRLADVSDEQLRQARRAVADTVAAYVHPDGHVRFPAHGYYATAARPGP